MKRISVRTGIAPRVLVACGVLACAGAACSAETPAAAAVKTERALAALVAALNDRYYKTPGSCGPNAAPPYLCSGIVESVREKTLDLTEGQYARDTVSFSYLRADVPTTLIWKLGMSGVIVNHFEGDGSDYQGYRMRARCLFPTDGATNTRADGCGIAESQYNPNPPGTSKPCTDQGIHTAQQWLMFHDRRLKNGWQQFGCSFGVTATDFRTAIAGQALTTVDGALGQPMRYQWNELVLGAWPASAAAELPAEAFFFMPENHLNNFARDLQCDYFLKTGRVVPIVRLRLPDRYRERGTSGTAQPGKLTVFSADIADQAVTIEHASREVCEGVLASSDRLGLYQGMSEAEFEGVREEVRQRYRGKSIPPHLSWLFERTP